MFYGISTEATRRSTRSWGRLRPTPMKKRISNESPVGKALLGKAVGSIVEVAVPLGTVRYQVVSIAK